MKSLPSDHSAKIVIWIQGLRGFLGCIVASSNCFWTLLEYASVEVPPLHKQLQQTPVNWLLDGTLAQHVLLVISGFVLALPFFKNFEQTAAGSGHANKDTKNLNLLCSSLIRRYPRFALIVLVACISAKFCTSYYFQHYSIAQVFKYAIVDLWQADSHSAVSRVPNCISQMQNVVLICPIETVQTLTYQLSFSWKSVVLATFLEHCFNHIKFLNSWAFLFGTWFIISLLMVFQCSDLHAREMSSLNFMFFSGTFLAKFTSLQCFKNVSSEIEFSLIFISFISGAGFVNEHFLFKPLVPILFMTAFLCCPALQQLFSCSLLVLMGRISFFFFLLHMILARTAGQVFISLLEMNGIRLEFGILWTLFTMIVFVCSGVISFALTYFLDEPTNKYLAENLFLSSNHAHTAAQ
jgi:hypothetical protein